MRLANEFLGRGTNPFKCLQAFVDVLADVQETTPVREHVFSCRSIDVAIGRIASHYEGRLGHENAIRAILSQLDGDLDCGLIDSSLTKLVGCGFGHLDQAIDHVVSIMSFLGTDGLAEE